MSGNEPRTAKSFLVRAAEHKDHPEVMFHHPLNPNSEAGLTSLSQIVGLNRIGLHLLRIPPGKESFVYHSHRTEEEFVYILSGRGIAEIGDESFEVGPGDFMGFPTPSVAHHLKNPFDEDLIYLSGGERKETEIADFPRINKRLVRYQQDLMIYSIDGATIWNLAEGIKSDPK